MSGFGLALGEQELATAMNELVEPYRERIYSPLDTLRLFVRKINEIKNQCKNQWGQTRLIPALEMDVLRCKSQHMVDKEIAVYSLANSNLR